MCDNCGKTFKNLPYLEGGGNIENGYFCSEKCAEKLLEEDYSQ